MTTLAFVQIMSARVVLIEDGEYRISDLFVNTEGSNELYARAKSGDFIRLNSALSTVRGEMMQTSSHNVKWERVSGIQIQRATGNDPITWIIPCDTSFDFVSDERKFKALTREK